MSVCWRLLVITVAALASPPVAALSQAVEPAASTARSIAPIPAPAPALDPAVDAYYAAHPGPLWLRDEDTRAAATLLAVRLKHAELDGLSDGPKLAASVEEALTRGQPADARLIASAWLQYVQTLRRPVAGVAYGEPTLDLKPPAAGYLLEQAGKAPSLKTYVEQTSTVNPFY